MISENNDYIEIDLKVITNASKNQLIFDKNEIKLKITALPIEGKANQKIIEFLADKLSLPKKNIQIIKGLKTNHKKIKIIGINKNKFLHVFQSD